MTLIYTAPEGQDNQLVQLLSDGQPQQPALIADSSVIPGLGVRLSNVRFCDANTTVPLAEQTGAIGAPFASVQDAVDSLLAQPGTIMLAPATYAESVTIDANTQFLGIAASRINVVTNINEVIANGTAIPVFSYCNCSQVFTATGGVIAFTSTLGLAVVGGALTAFFSTLNTMTVGFITQAVNSLFQGAISMTNNAQTSRFTAGCRFLAPADITGPGGTAELRFDVESWSNFNEVGNTAVGFANVRPYARLPTASVSLNVPALAAGATGEASASLVGTELAGITTASAIAINPPVAALAPGVGAGNGGLLSARITAPDTVTATFLGALTGGVTAGFLITRLT